MTDQQQQPIRRFPAEDVAIADLKPHPRNYVEHPDDQLEQIGASLRQHGFYRNVVIARDGTVLAGHGVVAAAKREGATTVPVIRLDVDPEDPRALKVLIGDNELRHLAIVDDRQLTDMLKQVKDLDADGLIGTGYDEKMLAALVLVTRNESEIKDTNDAEQWVGMPEFDPGKTEYVLTVSCDSEATREAFVRAAGVDPATVRVFRAGRIWSLRMPQVEESTRSTLRFVSKEQPAAADAEPPA